MFDLGSIFASLFASIADLFLGQILQLILGMFGGALG